MTLFEHAYRLQGKSQITQVPPGPFDCYDEYLLIPVADLPTVEPVQHVLTSPPELHAGNSSFDAYTTFEGETPEQIIEENKQHALAAVAAAEYVHAHPPRQPLDKVVKQSFRAHLLGASADTVADRLIADLRAAGYDIVLKEAAE